MRRKSTRSAAKSSPEKMKDTKKTRRQSRRHKQSSSESDSEDDIPLAQTQEISEERKAEVPAEVDETVWKVTQSQAQGAEDLQKIKICLTRPLVTTPERTSKRLRNKSVSYLEDEVPSPEEKVTRRSKRRTGSPKREDFEETEEKRSKGKSKGKHKSKIDQSSPLDETSQSELFENVQVTAQSPQFDNVDNKDVDNVDHGVNQTDDHCNTEDADKSDRKDVSGGAEQSSSAGDIQLPPDDSVEHITHKADPQSVPGDLSESATAESLNDVQTSAATEAPTLLSEDSAVQETSVKSEEVSGDNDSPTVPVVSMTDDHVNQTEESSREKEVVHLTEDEGLTTKTDDRQSDNATEGSDKSQEAVGAVEKEVESAQIIEINNDVEDDPPIKFDHNKESEVDIQCVEKTPEANENVVQIIKLDEDELKVTMVDHGRAQVMEVEDDDVPITIVEEKSVEVVILNEQTAKVMEIDMEPVQDVKVEDISLPVVNVDEISLPAMKVHEISLPVAKEVEEVASVKDAKNTPVLIDEDTPQIVKVDEISLPIVNVDEISLPMVKVDEISLPVEKVDEKAVRANEKTLYATKIDEEAVQDTLKVQDLTKADAEEVIEAGVGEKQDDTKTELDASQVIAKADAQDLVERIREAMLENAEAVQELMKIDVKAVQEVMKRDVKPLQKDKTVVTAPQDDLKIDVKPLQEDVIVDDNKSPSLDARSLQVDVIVDDKKLTRVDAGTIQEATKVDVKISHRETKDDVKVVQKDTKVDAIEECPREESTTPEPRYQVIMPEPMQVDSDEDTTRPTAVKLAGKVKKLISFNEEKPEQAVIRERHDKSINLKIALPVALEVSATKTNTESCNLQSEQLTTGEGESKMKKVEISKKDIKEVGKTNHKTEHEKLPTIRPARSIEVNHKKSENRTPPIRARHSTDEKVKKQELKVKRHDPSNSTDSDRKPKRSRRWGVQSVALKTFEGLLEVSTDVFKGMYPEIVLLQEHDVRLEPKERHTFAEPEPRRAEEKPVHHEYHYPEPKETERTTDMSVDNIIAMNRKISIVDDDASKLRPPPSPAKNETSDVLYITNLVRPFTIKQLRELLERTGNISEDGFWTDRIKSKCYVQYQTVEEAEATRNALHGVHWPICNGKKLMIDYATAECLEKARNPPAVVPVPVVVPEKENQEPEQLILKKAHKDREDGEKEVKLKAGHNVWEVDSMKEEVHVRRSRSKDRTDKRRYSRSRHSRSSSEADLAKKKQKKAEDVVPQRAMDDLFKKTETTPCIYWQPLSPEEIALKQQQRLERMAEHKRRMETQTRSKRGSDHPRGGPYRRRY